MTTDKSQNEPITLNFVVPPVSLKRIVEAGRLGEFVDKVGALASAHIQSQIMDQTARAAISGKNAGISVAVGFLDIDDFGNGPPHWPWPRGLAEDILRESAQASLTKRAKA